MTHTIARLRVLTFDRQPHPNHVQPIPDAATCDGTMLCPCDRCRQEVADRVRRGVRRRAGLPTRSAA
jgi:hypothetical protein